MTLAGAALGWFVMGPPTGEVVEGPAASEQDAPEDLDTLPDYAPDDVPDYAPDHALDERTDDQVDGWMIEFAPGRRQPDIRFRLDIDLPIAIGFASVFAVTEGFKPTIAPDPCSWCAPSTGELAISRAVAWADPEAAALTSDIVGYAGLPAFALALTLTGVGVEGSWRHVHEDLLVALEAVAVSGALTNAIKFASGRQRPYAHVAEAEGAPIPFAEDPDQNLSFPSGHTSLAFSLTTGFATVMTLRERKLAPVLWGVGVPTAAFVGYLRMAGNRHWLGDVVAGAGLGTLAGVGLPWLLHHPRTGVLPRAEARAHERGKARANFELRVLPSPQGVTVAGRI